MKEQKIETSPMTHGIFFQALSKSKEFKNNNNNIQNNIPIQK